MAFSGFCAVWDIECSKSSHYCLLEDRHFKRFSIYLRLLFKLVKKQLRLVHSIGCGEDFARAACSPSSFAAVGFSSLGASNVFKGETIQKKCAYGVLVRACPRAARGWEPHNAYQIPLRRKLSAPSSPALPGSSVLPTKRHRLVKLSSPQEPWSPKWESENNRL